MENSRDETIQSIKAAFKARGFRYSVKGGRGTAWGWITIDLLPAVHKALDHDGRKKEYQLLGERLMMDTLVYGPEDIPSSSAYYAEFVQRAQGIRPTVTGKPYWD